MSCGAQRATVGRSFRSALLFVVLVLAAAVSPPAAGAVPVTYYVGASTGVPVPGDGVTGVSPDAVYTAQRTTLLAPAPGTGPVSFERRTDYIGFSTLFTAFTPVDYVQVTRIGANATFTFAAQGAWDDFRVSLYDLETGSGASLLLGQASSGSGEGSEQLALTLDNPAAILPAGHRLQVALEVDKPEDGVEVAVGVNGSGEEQTATLRVDEGTDSAAPVTVLSTSPVGPGGDDDWFIGAPPLVTLSAMDPEGSATTSYYDIGVDPPATLYTGTITIPAGESVLYFRSVDIFGNTEPVRRQTFKVDTGVAAPTMSIPAGTEDAPVRLRGVVPLQASVADGVSGVQSVQFFVFPRQGEGFAAVGIPVGAVQTLPVVGEAYVTAWDTWLVPDGEYRLEAWVRDVAGNQSASQPQYALVDNMGPEVLILEPQAGARLAGVGVPITGTVADGDLASWVLEIRGGGDPSWARLASGTSAVTEKLLYTLDTTGYADGLYELKLSATDNAGNASTAVQAPLEIDNTRPTMVSATSAGAQQLRVGFSEPLDPDTVQAAAFTVPGLALSATTLDQGGRTVIVSTAGQSDGEEYLVSVATEPPTLTDLAGNPVGPPDSATFTGSTVDTLPPSAPIGLQATSGAGKNDLSWQAAPDPDVAGYNVYRDTSSSGSFVTLVNLEPVAGTTFSDDTYGEPGVYSYAVTAVDTSGNESPRSPVATAHRVRITAPVGSAGARLESSTGELLLVIPPGALSAEITVEVTEGSRPMDLGAYSFVGPSYDILPAGQTFKADVSLTLGYDPRLAESAVVGSVETTATTAPPVSSAETTPTAQPAEPSDSAIRLVYDKDGRWTRVEGGSTVDPAAQQVTGLTRHFTPFAPAVTDVVPPTVVGVSPVDGSTGVSVTTEVSLVFSEPMDPETFTEENLQIRRGDTAVPLDPVVFSTDLTTAYLYPREALEVSTEYTVVVKGSSVADEAGNPLGDDLSSGFTTSGKGVSPHAGYASATSLCSTCHGQGKPTPVVTSQEMTVCYTCHDGTGSAYGVKTVDVHAPYSWDFGEVALGETEKVSYHPVPQPTNLGTGVTMTCSNCHNAHSLGNVGNRYLAVRKVDPTLDGVYAAVTGNQFCWTCHNTSAATSAGYISTDSWNASTGYDHKTGFPSGDTGHNKLTGDLSMVNPRVPSQARIACKGCHSEHGSSNDTLIAEQVNGQAVAFDATSDASQDATYNGFCGACHVVAGSGGPLWPGGATGGTPSASNLSVLTTSTAPAYARSGHGASLKTRTLSYSPPVPAKNQVLTVGLCKQCHNPHGTQYRNYTLASEEALCYPCHDQDGPAALVQPGRTSVFRQFTVGAQPTNGVVAYRRPSGGASAVPLTRHPVTEGEQGRRVGVATQPGGSETAGTTGAIECQNCHNPHLNGAEPPPSLYWKVLDPNVQPGQQGYPVALRAYRSGNTMGGVSYNSTGGNPGSDYNPDQPLGIRASQPYNPPDGSFDSTPDSVYFCLACHDRSLPRGTDPPVGLGSSPLDIRADYLAQSTANALAHGRGTGNNLSSDDIYVRYPYRQAAGGSRLSWTQIAPARSYAALQCTTCHDPHGSQNVYLLREYIQVGGLTMNDSSTALGGTGGRGSGEAFSLPTWPMVADAGTFKLSNEFLIEFCGACHSQYGDFRNHQGGMTANGGPTGAGCDTAHNWSGWDPGNRGGLHDNNESDPTSRHKW